MASCFGLSEFKNCVAADEFPGFGEGAARRGAVLIRPLCEDGSRVLMPAGASAARLESWRQPCWLPRPAWRWRPLVPLGGGPGIFRRI